MSHLNELTEERISQSIEQDLGKIRREDGFWNDFEASSVTRKIVTAEQIIDSDMPFVTVIDGDTRRVAEESAKPKAPLAIFEIFLDLLVKDTDDGTRPRTLNRAAKDIITMVYSNPTRRRTDPLDAVPNALITHVESVERFDAALGYDDFGAARITVQVIYRYLWGDP